MKLEEGKRYITRGGEITAPLERRQGHHHSTPYIFRTKVGERLCTYTRNGEWNLRGEDDRDLVGEYAEVGSVEYNKQFVNEKNPFNPIGHDEEPVVDSTSRVRRFPSGAVRSDDRGRIRPDYISPYALEEIAKHFTKNEKEFGSDEDATNYFKGIRPVDVKGSIARHYLELMQSFHPYNADSVRENLRAMAANCIMALHQIAIEEKGMYEEPYEKTEYVAKK